MQAKHEREKKSPSEIFMLNTSHESSLHRKIVNMCQGTEREKKSANDETKPKICSTLDVKEKALWLGVWEPQMAGGPFYIHHQICGQILQRLLTSVRRARERELRRRILAKNKANRWMILEYK